MSKEAWGGKRGLSRSLADCRRSVVGRFGRAGAPSGRIVQGARGAAGGGMGAWRGVGGISFVDAHEEWGVGGARPGGRKLGAGDQADEFMV